MLGVGYNTTTGNRKWVSTNLPAGLTQGVMAQYMAAGPDGNICALSKGDSVYAYKYEPNTGLASGFPTLLYYRDSSAACNLNDMEMGKDGYIYLAGGCFAGLPHATYHDLLAKINPNTGGAVWQIQYSAVSGATMLDLAIDDAGNIYVLRSTGGGNVSMYYYMLKFDSNGNFIWQKGDVSGSIFVNGSNLYVTKSGSTVQYDLNGNQIRSMGDSGSKMVFDSQGNIYIIGNPLRKYDSNFNLIWSLPISAADLAIDNDDNLYIYDGATTVRKYDSDGNWFWTGSSLLFTGKVFTVDKSAQAAYITGSVGSSDGLGTDIVTAKFYNPSPEKPTVSTDLAIVNIQNNTVTLKGTITNTNSQNADLRGFNWNNEGGSWSSWTEGTPGNYQYGEGSFSHNLTNITPDTVYYYKAKARNSGGWGYGEEKRFVIFIADGGQREFTTSGPNRSPYKPTDTEESWDHCSFEGTSKVTLSWKYSDPDGDFQDSYRVLIDNNSDFSSPEIDSCSGSESNCPTGITSSSYTPIPNLSWSTTYYWKVKTKDSGGNWSEYSDPKPFTTLEHAYPWPQFSFDPQRPTKDDEISFYNETVYFGQQPIFRWEFGDGTISYEYEPKHIYTRPSDYTVVLYARDEIGECSHPRVIKVATPLPWWREIIPKFPF